MQIQASTPEGYIEQLPDDRKEAIGKLRNVILKNLPDGFVEAMSYGMIGYVIPHSRYPRGYHAKPDEPLPFINLASQKNHVALYHMAIYADRDLMDWFLNEYARRCTSKLDMGKICIRFKKMSDIPYDLIGELAGRVTAEMWIEIYEREIRR